MKKYSKKHNVIVEAFWGMGVYNELSCPGKSDASVGIREKRGMRSRNKLPCSERAMLALKQKMPIIIKSRLVNHADYIKRIK